jgi:hypothetical protein
MMKNSSAEHAFTMEELPSLPSECSSRTAALWAATLLLQEGEARGWDLVDTRHTVLMLALHLFPRDASEIAVMSELQRLVRQVLTNRRPPAITIPGSEPH